jgi:4-amino-4-deoxy-L-arabinose transferase-like glycosyltransferase
VLAVVLAAMAQWRFGGTLPADGVPWLAAGVAVLAMAAATLSGLHPARDTFPTVVADPRRLARWPWRLVVLGLGAEAFLLYRLVGGSEAGRDLLIWIAALIGCSAAFLPPALLRWRPVFRGASGRPALEVAGLAAVVVAFLVAAIHDIDDWYYSVIGDEYLFYQWAREAITDGVIRPFTQNGVYDSHPMLATVYQASVMEVFDGGNAGWRLSSALAIAAAIPAVYVIGRELGGRLAASAATIAFAASHYLLAYAHTGYDTAQAIAPTAWAIALLLLGLRRGNPLLLYLAGIAAGLGFYTFFSARAGAAVLILAILATPALWRRAGQLWPLAFGFALAVLPLLAVNGTEVVTGIFSEAAGGYDEGVSGDPIDRISDNLSTNLLAFNMSHHIQHYVSGPLLDPLTAAAAVVGVGLCLGSMRQFGPRILLLWFAVGFVATGLVAPYPHTAISRMSMLVAPAALFAGLAIDRGYALVATWTGSRIYSLVLTAALLVTIVVANGHRFWFATPARFHLSQQAVAIGASRSELCDGGPATIIGRDVQSVLRTAVASYGLEGTSTLSYRDIAATPVTELAGDGCVIFTHPADDEAAAAMNALFAVQPDARLEPFSDEAMKGQVLVFVP